MTGILIIQFVNEMKIPTYKLRMYLVKMQMKRYTTCIAMLHLNQHLHVVI